MNLRKILRYRTTILIVAGMILAVLLLFFFVINRWSVTITVNGEASQKLECGVDYTDAGATARFHGSLICKKGWDVPVTTDGSVDTSEPGTYKITYTAKKDGIRASASRKVLILDHVPPVITLTSDPDNYTVPGEAYKEEGYKAEDNIDGDITDKVKRKEKDGVVTYSVTDSSGNETTVTRQINYKDTVPPKITLLGDSTMTLSAGEEFNDPGYTASDNCDGDLTDRVTTDSALDTYRSGTYTIHYQVTDNSGNTADATREVTVNPVRQADTVVPSGKIIYLTFDDGPGQYTEKLLDVLAKYNVKVTFFTVNTTYTDLLAKEAAAGHSVGIHSASHDYAKIYANESAYFSDLHEMESVITQQTGISPKLLRFPGGSGNSVSAKYCTGIMSLLTKDVLDQGYQYFDWNVSSGDAGGTTDTETVFQNVINGVQQHDVSIVLQHDIKGFSVDAVEKILAWGITNGYTFLPLDVTSPTAHQPVNN